MLLDKNCISDRDKLYTGWNIQGCFVPASVPRSRRVMSSGEANLKSCKMDTDPGGFSFFFSSSFSSTSPEIEVTEIISAEVWLRYQLLSHSHGFLSRLQIFKSIGPSLWISLGGGGGVCLPFFKIYIKSCWKGVFLGVLEALWAFILYRAFEALLRAAHCYSDI